MKKKDIIDLKIDKMVYGGESLCTEDVDKKVLFKGGITGQVVQAMITRKQKDKYKARILSVVEKSPFESEPTCNNFGRCGGCLMLSVPYEKQLHIKSDMLLDLFHKYGHDDIRSLEIVGSPDQFGYKNKMEFTFGNEVKDGELILGLHRKNSSMSIVDVTDCMIIDEDYRRIVSFSQGYFREKNLPHYHIMSHEGFLRHLVVRKGKNTGEILVNIVTTSQVDFDLSEYVNSLLDLELDGKIVGILHTVNDSLSDAVVADRMDVLFGSDVFYDEIFGKRFKISPFSFFQTNTLGSEVLYSTALDMIEGKKGTIFDLYSGTGTIGICLADKAQKVVGIEIVEEAVEMAAENAARNNVTNAEFIAGDVKDEITKLSDQPELIILDPPRGGINPKALLDTIEFNAKEIVYISCNPKMLAQDLVVLKENGYKIKNIKAVDMFPHTAHAEVVCYLVKE